MGAALGLGAVAAAALFVYGVLSGSYVALAVPVAAGTLFVLGLVAWIGWTIATVRVEAEGSPLDASGSGGAGGATRPEPDADPPERPDP
ncbi:MAG: hypothetical protein J4G09_06740 [Proteobacteria bacterium]|nr:hypothetical protein [Pseudomonadota bacterium]